MDIFDDRMEIYSPGGMVDGTNIQDRNLETIPSTRRNPVLADIFDRLGLMEREGSGIKKIRSSYIEDPHYNPEKQPMFYSDRTTFMVTFPNLNYGMDLDIQGVTERVTERVTEKVTEGEREVLELLKENPEYTYSDLADRLSVSRKTVSDRIKKLKEKNRIERIGSDTKGYWNVI